MRIDVIAGVPVMRRSTAAADFLLETFLWWLELCGADKTDAIGAAWTRNGR
jgi:hypothetical protein